MTPWGEAPSEEATAAFDLDQIVANGELIALALTGPETYYVYRGRELGTEYMLCQRFTNKIGVSLRVEVCRDTAELLQRLGNDDGDLAIVRLDADTTVSGWMLSYFVKFLIKV